MAQVPQEMLDSVESTTPNNTNIVDSPVDTGLTTTVTKPETDLAQKVGETPVAPEIFNRADQITKIDESLKGLGGDAIANKAIIEGIAKTTGKRASSEDLTSFGFQKIGDPEALKGLGEDQIIRSQTGDIFKLGETNLGNVVNRFGIGGELSNFGIQPNVPELERTAESLARDKEIAAEEAAEKPLTALDKQKELVAGLASGRNKVIDEASTGLDAIQGDINTAQASLGELKASLDQASSDVELQDILNTEAQIALKDKIEGKTITMASINRQLTAGMEDLTQAQRLDRVYDVYALNSKVNQYNAQLANLEMLQGQYDKIEDKAEARADDWKEMKMLELDILEQEGQLEKEARAEAEAEINFQNELGLQGYSKIESMETYEKLVKDFGVTAGTFSQFFWKNANGDIYLKPSTDETLSIAEAKSLGVPFGTTKSQAMNMGITPSTSTSGSTKTVGFKMSSDDRGRLLAVNFTNDDITGIQEDINEFGIESVVAGMDETQAKAVRDVASGLTATQANAQDKPETITEGKRKVVGGINALISDNASNEELKEYVELKGYTLNDFKDILEGYTPEEKPSNWEKVKSFFGF